MRAVLTKAVIHDLLQECWGGHPLHLGVPQTTILVHPQISPLNPRGLGMGHSQMVPEGGPP